MPTKKISKTIIKRAYKDMYSIKTLVDLYEENFKVVSKYVHATSRGHEAVQLAAAYHLKSCDYVTPYYRDDALLLGIGITPYELMLQLLAKKEDIFSGGRSYYSHPSLRREDMPKIPHQSSATGMQAIPAAGIAMGMRYKKIMSLNKDDCLTVCSIGDAAMTEGEVSEALHMSGLKQLPIIFLVQDNEWDISAKAEEIRTADVDKYVQGFDGINFASIDGTDFTQCFTKLKKIFDDCRKNSKPYLVHAKVPLLNHHTSGVRKEWYRDDLEEDAKEDPLPKLYQSLLDHGFSEKEISKIEKTVKKEISTQYDKALISPDPEPEEIYLHEFAETEITKETGERKPKGAEEKVMVDCALIAMQEILADHPEALFYGQDVGARLGGVFREAATLGTKYGNERVFNTPIQEAFIVGSTVGMSAVGLKPIVEVQFADYIWPGLNQLFTEVSRSCYLTNGKWPVSMVLRVPTGAYGSGGPYHSSSVESILTNIKGIKIVYPSNGADLKGLLKAAFYDPNPVIILEHKGLYWSKVSGTDRAKTAVPSSNYVIPIGEANVVQSASTNSQDLLIISYGMGVHWSFKASEKVADRVTILDLRSLYPLDMEAIYRLTKQHNKVMIVTEEPVNNGFAQSIAARVQENCFEHLDGPVKVVGSKNVPAIPLNDILEKTYLPSISEISDTIQYLLDY